MTSSRDKERAEHLLYKVYFRLCLEDILNHLRVEPTAEAKTILHDFHKRVLGYKTIAGESHEAVSRFIQKVCLFWAERGLFVRTSKKQPPLIQWMELADVWELL